MSQIYDTLIYRITYEKKKFNILHRRSAMKFNAKKFINDCGGVNEVASRLSKSRTAPYRMMTTRYMTTWHFETLLDANPSVNINDYFEQDKTDEPNGRTKKPSV